MPVPSEDPTTIHGEGAPPWRELCVVCSHPVYLAQRLRVQGNLYHRTCFRCARCSAQLTLVDYYETHDGKFVCETCPDESPAAAPPPAEGEEPRVTATTPVGTTLTPSVTNRNPASMTDPELSPAARQSIVAMRRMFFDTDDAKLTRSETLRADLPPADIPITPNDRVKPRIVNIPVDDKTSDSPKIVDCKSDSPSSLELPNTGACVEYQSDNASPSILRLADKSNSSLNLEDNLADKSSNRRTSRLNDSPPVHETQSSSFKAPSSPTKNLERTTDENQLKHSDSCKIVENPDSPENICDSGTSGTIPVIPITEPSNASEVPETKPEIDGSDKNIEDVDENLKLVQESVKSDELNEAEHSELVADKVEFGESEVGTDKVVEAVNDLVAPPPRPKRRQKSPKATPRKASSEYPENLNPFGDDDEDDAPVGTNPFGTDSDEETEPVLHSSTPIKTQAPPPTSPYKAASASPGSDRRMSDLSPVRKAPSLNPFGDSDEEDEPAKTQPAIPMPLPRKTAPSPEPMPFPRSSLRASQRSIASTLSTSSRKKRPAPPPPVPMTTPPSPSTTIRSTRSRKTRRAPLPPGMASSRLSLASDSISIGGDSVYRGDATADFPEQVSHVVDRISEWVEATNLEVKGQPFNDSRTSEVDVSTDISVDLSSSLPVSSPEPERHPPGTPAVVPAIEVTDDQVHVTPTECHIEVPKTEPIAQSPIPSPVRKDLSPTFDNKSLIKSPDDVTFRKKIIDEDENIKETVETRKSLVESDFTETVPQKKPVVPLEPSISITNRNSLTDSDVEDRLLSNKKNKDDVNMTRKISGGSTGSSCGGGYNLHKSAHGQWRRKSKAPAPPLPLAPDPNRSTLKKGAHGLPLFKIKQELNDIEIKQQGLERQGVELEARIRDKFDSDASITPYVEELVLQLFELVNEKNELFRKQAELMYLRRQQHLEEEQAELEKEIRDLMSQPEVNKTDSDKELEEQLIQRLVEVVERRDAIVQCLEMDRIREAEEDRSISAQLNVFTKAMAPEDKSATTPKKKRTNPDGSKKKWYTLSRSPKKSVSPK